MTTQDINAFVMENIRRANYCPSTDNSKENNLIFEEEIESIDQKTWH